MRPPVYYLPVSPATYQRNLKLLMERGNLTIEQVASRIEKDPEWVRLVLEDPKAMEPLYAEAVQRCIEENHPHYTAAEITAMLEKR